MSGSDVGGYYGEADAFNAYTAGMRPLAEQVGGLTRGGELDFADGAFSKIGDEVGLTAALRAANLRQAQGVQGLAASYDGTAQAVSNTWTNFEDTEHEGGRWVRRAAGEDV